MAYDLKVKHLQPSILHCDNQRAIYRASNSVFAKQTKDIEIDCHYFREKIHAGVIQTVYLHTSEQPSLYQSFWINSISCTAT